MLHKAWVLREVVVLAMFEHKESSLLEQATFHYDVGHLWQLLQSIRRIGKDEVEAFTTACQISKHIGTDGEGFLCLQLIHETADEAEVEWITLHRHHVSASSAQQFQGDASRTRKEVQCRGLFIEVQVSLQDIEEILLGKVGGGSGFESAWYLKAASLVFACYYAHISMCRI